MYQNNYEHSRAWTMGKQERFKGDFKAQKDYQLSNVAPGTYQQSMVDKKNEPQWTMGAKHQLANKQVSAAPGQYNIPSRIAESPGKSMGARFKSSMQPGALGPGPGQYTGDKQRLGDYKYSMGSRIKSTTALDIPGPGQYNSKHEAIIESVKTGKFGTGQRSALELRNSRNQPGPGNHSPDYRINKTAAPNYGFGQEQRKNSEAQLKRMPGPGQYQIPSLMGKEGQGKTLGSMLTYSPEMKESLKKPGPGTYDGNSLITRKQDPQYKMGTSSRQDLIAKKKNMNQQDPGRYNPNDEFTSPGAAKWGFGSEKRLNPSKLSLSPGAGTYNLPSQLESGPKYGMAAKLNSGSTQNLRLPGPGYYETQDKDNINMNSAPKFGLGTSKRSAVVNRSISNLPAPGSYDISMVDKQNNPNFGFGTSKREGRNKGGLQPGPGQYSLKNLLGNEGKQYSLHNKLNYKPIENIGKMTPGPGQYDQKGGQGGPAWGQGTSKRDGNRLKDNSPAPGSYSPQTGYTQNADPRFGFGTDKRRGLIDANKSALGPGPGNYNLESAAFDQRNSKFHMGQRLPPIKDTTKVPGAGSYDPSPNALKGGPSYSMKSKINTMHQNKTPGPGSYEANQNDKLKAAQYGFGTSKRDQASPLKNGGNPGPGSYKINYTVGDTPQYAIPNRSEQYKYV